ncbi:MAG: DUF2520 domain-containing protein, partial [Parvularculaceae bacterium]|nr:DUF2520 domain-containing protein [Parvularculaceae bacterium]
FPVAEADRAVNHALAVVSGNFATFLWNESAKAAAGRLGLDPATLFAPYFASLVDRFVENPADSLTGPVARRDAATVEANLAALESEPRLYAAYEAFLGLAWPDDGRRN